MEPRSHVQQCCKSAQCNNAQFSCKLFSRAGMVISKCCTLNYFILHDILLLQMSGYISGIVSVCSHIYHGLKIIGQFKAYTKLVLVSSI